MERRIERMMGTTDHESLKEWRLKIDNLTEELNRRTELVKHFEEQLKKTEVWTKRG